MTNKLGKSISELRKQKGVTQEELAKAVGVTAQAVSKWEGGGTPDVDLLIPIADYFGVPVDRLFGRNINTCGDIETEVAKYIAGSEQNKLIEKAFELCWAMQQGISGKTEIDRQNSIQAINEKQQGCVYSRMIHDSGITLMALNKEMQYFMLMPEPEFGWLKELGDKEGYLKIFKMLAEPDILNTLFLLYSRDNKPFTPKLLEKKFGVPSDRAVEILNILGKYKLVNTSEIELDDEVQKVYNFKPNPTFIAILSICKELIRGNKLYYFYNENRSRNKPYLGNCIDSKVR